MITASDTGRYMTVNRPADDSSLAGGAYDPNARFLTTTLAAAAVVAIQSDGADTRTFTVRGRREDNDAIDSDAIVANGTNEVAGAIQFKAGGILDITASAGDAARTVQIKEGAGGTTRHTIAPDETFAAAHTREASAEASGGSSRDYYEIECIPNRHATDTLGSAQIELTSDPASIVQFAVESAKDGTSTHANRLTAPTGFGSYNDDSVLVGVPGGQLDAGEYIRVASRTTLAAGLTPATYTFTYTVHGTQGP